MDTARQERFLVLVNKLTSHGQSELPQEELTALKQLCRTFPDAAASETIAPILAKLETEHSQVRYAALLVIGELFARWSAFRTAVVEKLSQLLPLTLGENGVVNTLPLPVRWAAMTREKMITLLLDWLKNYGAKYKQLQLTRAFLLQWNIDLEKMEKQARQIEAAEQRRRTLEAERNERRFDRAILVLHRFAPEVRAVVDRTNELFTTLLDDDTVVDPVRGDDEMEKSVSTLFDDPDLLSAAEKQLPIVSNDRLARELGLGSASYRLDIELDNAVQLSTTEKNEKSLRAATDCVELLKKKFVGYVERITKQLRQCAPVSRHDERDRYVKMCEELLEESRKVISLYEDLRVEMPDSNSSAEKVALDEYEGADNSDEEDMASLEDVNEDEFRTFLNGPDIPASGLESDPLPASTSASPSNPLILASSPQPLESNPPSSTHPPVIPQAETESAAMSERERLLAIAPVVPFGLDLEFWGVDELPQWMRMNQITSYHRFWGSGEHENELSQEQLEERLRKRVVYLRKPELQPTPQCGARLSSGKLCPRRDIKRCPLHGPIVPRDEHGQVIGDVPQPQPDVHREEEATKSPPTKRRKKQSNLEDISDKTPKFITNLHTAMRRKQLGRNAIERDLTQRLNYNQAKFGHQWQYM